MPLILSIEFLEKFLAVLGISFYLIEQGPQMFSLHLFVQLQYLPDKRVNKGGLIKELLCEDFGRVL
jgi:hypothetical protein